MLNGRLYRAAFAPFVVVLAISAFSLAAREHPLSSALAPDAFDGARAFAEVGSLAQSFPDRAPGSRADDALASRVAATLEGLGSPRSGGLGIEKKLEDLAEAKSLPPGSVAELILIGDRAAVVAEMVKPHDPGKKQKQWADFASAMAKEAAAMAAAARNKNAAMTLAAANRLNKSCTNCHDVFK